MLTKMKNCSPNTSACSDRGSPQKCAENKYKQLLKACAQFSENHSEAQVLFCFTLQRMERFSYPLMFFPNGIHDVCIRNGSALFKLFTNPGLPISCFLEKTAFELFLNIFSAQRVFLYSTIIVYASKGLL